MTWRYLAVRYSWSAVMYQLLRSSRRSDDEKAVHLAMLGMLMSVPFAASQILWLSTGRGPIRWLYRPTSVAFVDAFRTWKWNAPEGAWDRYIAAGRRKYGDPFGFEPTSQS